MNLFELDSSKPRWINLIKLPFNLLAVVLWCIIGSGLGIIGAILSGLYHWLVLTGLALEVVFKKNGI